MFACLIIHLSIFNSILCSGISTGCICCLCVGFQAFFLIFFFFLLKPIIICTRTVWIAEENWFSYKCGYRRWSLQDVHTQTLIQSACPLCCLDSWIRYDSIDAMYEPLLYMMPFFLIALQLIRISSWISFDSDCFFGKDGLLYFYFIIYLYVLCSK